MRKTNYLYIYIYIYIYRYVNIKEETKDKFDNKKKCNPWNFSNKKIMIIINQKFKLNVSEI